MGKVTDAISKVSKSRKREKNVYINSIGNILSKEKVISRMVK